MKAEEAAASEWLVWQVVDSAFPTGAFAHSCGLEAAWQQGEIAGDVDVRRFTSAAVLQAACSVVPLVNAAYHSPDRLAELDDLAEAFLTSPAANRASRMQGRTLAATAAKIWPCAALERLARHAASGYAHAGPMTGAVFAALRLPLAAVQRLVLYGTARSVLSAAVRLGVAGSYEAQRLLHECGPWLAAQLERCAGYDERDLAQTAPVLELLQAGHDRLYSRLFLS